MQGPRVTNEMVGEKGRWSTLYRERSDITLRYALLIFVGLALMWLWLGSPERALNQAFAMVGTIIGYLINKKVSDSRVGSACFLLFMICAMMGDIVYAGMSQAPTMWVLPIFPMLAGHLLGSRSVLPFCGLVAVLIIGVHVAEALGFQAPEPFLFPGEHVFVLVSMTMGYCRVAYFSRKTLEDSSKTLKEQAIDLIQSKFQADRASIAKSTFLANMSQQVKIPLQGASRDAQGLVDAIGEQDLEHALALRECTDRIEWIVSDIVDISRIESGALSAQAVPINFELLRDSITIECFELAQAAKIRIEFEQEGQAPTVLGDPQLLSRLVTILVLDAICRARSSVLIDFQFSPTQAGSCMLQLKIRHDGLVEDVEGSEVVFGMRVQDDERGIPAKIGLGLSMAESLANYMGGGVDLAHDDSVHEYQRVASVCLPYARSSVRAA